MSSEIQRTLLETSPVENMPGWETRLFLIHYPPGADGSGHWHPVRGIGYVLSGTMVSAFGDDPPVTFLAGQSFQDEANITHTIARNGSATEPMIFLIAYTVKTGEPNTVYTPSKPSKKLKAESKVNKVKKSQPKAKVK
jgi:quercetin dioxygenase-like cupin family protein